MPLWNCRKPAGLLAESVRARTMGGHHREGEGPLPEFFNQRTVIRKLPGPIASKGQLEAFQLLTRIYTHQRRKAALIASGLKL